MDFVVSCREGDLETVRGEMGSRSSNTLNEGFLWASDAQQDEVMQLLARSVDLHVVVIKVLIPACQDGDVATIHRFLTCFPPDTRLFMSAYLGARVEGPPTAAIYSIADVLATYANTATLAQLE